MAQKLSSLFLAGAAASLITLAPPTKTQAFGVSATDHSQDDFNTRAYQAQSRNEKRAKLWDAIEANQWGELPPLNGSGWASLLTNLQAALTLKPTMDYSSDVLPEGRIKFIHTYGVAGPVTFIPAADTPYTGLFAEESVGLARLSVAADPNVVSFTPGMGLKFLIDGQPSLNVLAMPSLDGQGDNPDFFAYSFTTHIAEPQNPLLKILGWWFSLTEKEPSKLPVDLLASVTPSGKSVAKPLSPTVLEFEPAASLRETYSPDRAVDYRIPLQNIKPGTLFKVYGKRSLEASDRNYMGELRLDASLVASEFADKKLFFRHMRKNP
jgi:hypothetical protein